MDGVGVVIVFGLAGAVVVAGLVTALIVLLHNRRKGHGASATGLPTSPTTPHGTAGGAATGAIFTGDGR